jgi:hypothetical protein
MLPVGQRSGSRWVTAQTWCWGAEQRAETLKPRPMLLQLVLVPSTDGHRYLYRQRH